MTSQHFLTSPKNSNRQIKNQIAQQQVDNVTTSINCETLKELKLACGALILSTMFNSSAFKVLFAFVLELALGKLRKAIHKEGIYQCFIYIILQCSLN